MIASSGVTSGNATVTYSSTALPASWFSQDIGSPSPTGISTYSGGTYTISGGGSDIAGSSDHFTYAYTSLSGNGTVVARVPSVQNTSSAAKAGVMIRQSTAANAAYAAVFITPGSGAIFQWRASTGGGTSSIKLPGFGPTCWVKLTRSGNTFDGYVSKDGVTWKHIGASTVSMPTAVNVGLAVTSRHNGVLNTSTFDHVSMLGG